MLPYDGVMKKIFLAIILPFIVTCSSYKSKDFEKTEHLDVKKVEKDFNVDKKTLKKYFSTPKEVTPAKKEVKSNKAIVKSKIKEKKPKDEIKEKLKTDHLSKNQSKSGAIHYPIDYPEEFKILEPKLKSIHKTFKTYVFRGEKLYIDISYLGVNAGQIVVETLPDTTVGGVSVYHYYARLKSAAFYKYIYELDDTIDSYVQKDNFLSLKYTLLQRESGQNVDDIQIYDSKNLKTRSLYKRIKKKKNNAIKKWNKEAFIPAFYSDALSVLHYMRGLPLKVGDLYPLPVINKAKVLILNTKVIKKEKISTELGTFNAIKINVKSSYSGETIKSGDMTFWFSDDDRRILLKINAKIKIGSIVAETVKYER